MDDAPAVQRYASDDRVAETTTIPRPYPEDGGLAFVKKGLELRRQGKGFPFAILAGGDVVGVVEIGGVDTDTRTAQCDYAIASSHWGQGITTKAVSLALAFAFQELGLESMISACLARNPASARVLEKNGFTEIEGFVYSKSKFKDEPARRFQLSRADWLRRHK